MHPPYIIKPNNRSGCTYKVLSDADVQESKIVKLCREWLAAPTHGKAKGEWAYKNSENQIVIEKYLGPTQGTEDLAELCFHIFDGDINLISYFASFTGDNTVNYFNSYWNRLPIVRVNRDKPSPSLLEVPIPRRLDEMKVISRRLAGDIDYLRVDFYYIHDEIFGGELTPYHRSGFSFICREGACVKPIPPSDIDDEIGEAWKIPAISWPKKIYRGLCQ